MAKEQAAERVDRASRVILASPRTLFRAFVDPEMLASWRAPEGMTARVEGMEPRVGGGYRIVLTYAEGSSARGKSSAHEDVAEVRFVELMPEERIVEAVRFVSDDPAHAGTMHLTTSFDAVADGTKVTMAATGVPLVIAPEDHQSGMASSLRNLALLTE